MNILVTGGAGYVGSTLVPELLAAGHCVRVLDNLMYGQRSLLQCFVNRRFQFIRGDVRDEATLTRALGAVDLVIHLAAIVGAPACRRDPQLAETVNFGAVALLNHVRRKDQKIVFASTTSRLGSGWPQLRGELSEDSREKLRDDSDAG